LGCDFRLHPAKEKFGRDRGDSGALQLQDLLALAPDLNAHEIDFPSNLVEVRHLAQE